MINKPGINHSFVEKYNFSLNKQEEFSNKIITQQKQIEQLRLSLAELSEPISLLESTHNLASSRAECCYNKVRTQLVQLKQGLDDKVSNIKLEIDQHEQETSVLENRLQELTGQITKIKDEIKSNKRDNNEWAQGTTNAERSVRELTEETHSITTTINTNNARICELQEKKLGILKIIGYCTLCLTLIGIIAVVVLERSRSAENKVITQDKDNLLAANRNLTQRQTKIIKELQPEASQILSLYRALATDAKNAGINLGLELSNLSNMREAVLVLASMQKLDTETLKTEFMKFSALEAIIPAEVPDLQTLATHLKQAILDHPDMDQKFKTKLMNVQTEITNFLEANTSSSNVAQELQEKRNEATAIGAKIIAAEDELVEMKKTMRELEYEISLELALFESSSESDKSEKRDYALEPRVELEHRAIAHNNIEPLAEELIALVKLELPNLQKVKLLLSFFHTNIHSKTTVQEIVKMAIEKADADADEDVLSTISQLKEKNTFQEVTGAVTGYYLPDPEDNDQIELMNLLDSLENDQDLRLLNEEIALHHEELKSASDYAAQFITQINQDEAASSNNFLNKYEEFLTPILTLAVINEVSSIKESIMGAIFMESDKITNPSIKEFVKLLIQYQYLGDEQQKYMNKDVDLNHLEEQRVLAELMPEFGGIQNLGVAEGSHYNSTVMPQTVQQHILKSNENKSLIPVKNGVKNNEDELINNIVNQSEKILALAMKNGDTKGNTFKDDMLIRIISYPAFDNRNEKIMQALEHAKNDDFEKLAQLYMETKPLLPREMFDFIAQEMGVVHEKQFISLAANHYSSIFGKPEDTPSSDNRCWAYSLNEMRRFKATIEANQRLRALGDLIEQGLVLDRYKSWTGSNPDSLLSILVSDMNA